MSRAKRLPAAKGEGRRLRNVWLVQPPIGGNREDVGPPLGLLALAATLERAGDYRVRIADLHLRAHTAGIDVRRSLPAQLKAALPKRASEVDLIGVSAWSYNFDVTMEFVEAAKRKHPHATLVLGGPHTTFVDREALEAFPSVDYVLRDEGDWTFPRLVKAIEDGARPDELAAIPGLTWRRGGEVVRNPSGGVVEDLDALPYPAYHLIDVREYLACQPTLVIEAGRGCPYNCNFCSTTNMFQRAYRVKSPARLVDEVEWLMGVSGTNRFELLHDNLVAKGRHVRALCQEIRARNLDVDWSCTSRTDNMTEELAEEMFLAGCGAVFFGVESLSAERQRWTGKRLEPQRVHEVMELTRRQHITPTLGIILGFPDETREEFDATVGAAVRWTSAPEVRAEVSTAVLRYYPGADLFERADALRYDPLAAADASALPGYALREAWRGQTRLFPLQAIHTPPEETRRNLLRRNFVRALLKVCPLTFRACLDVLGLGPMELLDRLAASAEDFTHLRERKVELLWNEAARALAGVVVASGSAEVRELLTSELPFWETLPVAEPLDRLEHVVHPKRFDQDELLAYCRGERPEPPGLARAPVRDGRDGRARPGAPSVPRAGTLDILGLRAGRETVVWITDRAEEILAVFLDSYARDRRGTVEYVRGLKRGQV